MFALAAADIAVSRGASVHTPSKLAMLGGRLAAAFVHASFAAEELAETAWSF